MQVHIFTKPVYKRAAVIIVFVFIQALVYGDVISEPLKIKLATSSPYEDLGVIITLNDKVPSSLHADKPRHIKRTLMIKDLKRKANTTQLPLKDLLKHHGIKSGTSLWFKNSLAIEVKPAVIRELARQPYIESINLDETVTLAVTQSALHPNTEWNINRIHAPELWALGYTGQGIVIASLDTGVDGLHADLAGKWRGGKNSWFDPHGQHATPYDRNGHGTQVMGVIVGGDLSGSFIGTAFNSRWIAVKIYNDAGYCKYSHIHAGFQWLLDPDGDPDSDDAPDIVNNSWGLDNQPNKYLPEFQEDIRILKAAGIAVVCSAGNAGPAVASSVSPANYPESLSVGATDSYDYPAYFSSRGPSAYDKRIYPQLVAPAADIMTADLTMRGLLPYSYTYVSGTSLASGQVAGALALLLSAMPACPPEKLEQALISTATDLGFPGPDNETGYGLINAFAAFNKLKATGGY